MTSAVRPAWLPAFRAGERAGIEACYREYFDVVDRAVGTVLRGADRDTVVHEVFYKLIERPEVRNSYAGRSFSGWLSTMARNHALDFVRRLGRETGDVDDVIETHGEQSESPESTVAARGIVSRFSTRLPDKLRPVFEQRFVERRTQREAASALGMPRMTLAYHEQRIRSLIKRFLAELEP